METRATAMHNLAHQLTVLPFNLFMSWQHLAIVKTKVFCDADVAEAHEKRPSFHLMFSCMLGMCINIILCLDLHEKVSFFFSP